jgi:N,N-dimethylformamidase beta subunit-like protein
VLLVCSLVALGYVWQPSTPRLRPSPVAAVAVKVQAGTSGSVSTVFSVATENSRLGTTGWRIRAGTPRTADGYADRVSAQDGETVTLYVSTAARSFRVEAYRVGWYGGLGGRLVWRSGNTAGVVQPPPTMFAATGIVSAPWAPSLRVPVTAAWPPGEYLLKLVAGHGQSYVPLTVRDDASRAPVLVMNAVTTWQAYNDWGGYDLYHGPLADPSRRSKMASFDRPYAGTGADEFVGNEIGVVTLVERMGLGVSYTTDIDIHAHPELIPQHRVLVSLGHDEYWSPQMRAGVEAARDHGVNLMFLGANAVFRRIRLQSSALGAARVEVNYRVARDDPLYGLDNGKVTANWRDAPEARPESALTGVFYQCNPAHADGVVVDATSWIFDGTGLRNGDHLPNLIGPEYDQVDLQVPTPKTIEVLLHSPLSCHGKPGFSDAAIYSAPSGAEVFDTGTSAWVCKLNGCPEDTPRQPDPRIVRITENVLRAFAYRDTRHPTVPNLAHLGIHP